MKMKYYCVALIIFALSTAFAQQKDQENVPVYYPVSDNNTPTAFIGVPFKVDGEYSDRQGQYKVELRICDTNNLCIGKLFLGPYAQFTSTSPEDAGKDIEVTTYFRSTNSAGWKKIRSAHAKINPAPLKVVMLDKIPENEQRVQAYYGIEGYSVPPSSAQLEVQSQGYFEPTAVMYTKVAAAEQKEKEPLHEEMAPQSAEYILKPTDRYKQLSAQTKIQIIFRDAQTGRSFSKSVTLLPPQEATK